MIGITIPNPIITTTMVKNNVISLAFLNIQTHLRNLPHAFWHNDNHNTRPVAPQSKPQGFISPRVYMGQLCIISYLAILPAIVYKQDLIFVPPILTTFRLTG
jgi:hypothetical protein